MYVKGIEAVVPHDGRLKDVAALPVQHEQGLVHLHGLVCRWEKSRGKVMKASDEVLSTQSIGSDTEGRHGTCGLEVERYQLGAAEPHGKRVIVGGV